MSKSLDEMRKEFQHWQDTDRKLHEPSIFRNDEAWMAWQHQQDKIDAKPPSLTERQKRVSEWAVERFGARKSGTCCLLQVQAHLGYLTRLHLSDHSGLEPALGDLMLHLLDYCEANGVDLDAALNKAMVRRGILLDRWREKH